MTTTTRFRLHALGFLLMGAGISAFVHHLASLPVLNVEAAALNVAGAVLLVLADRRPA